MSERAKSMNFWQLASFPSQSKLDALELHISKPESGFHSLF